MTINKCFQGVLYLLLPVVMVSCYYLDKKPDNLLTEDMIWQTRANAESYLNNIYGYMHNTDGGDYASMGASDETSVCIPGVNVRQMIAGNWSAASGYFYNWGAYYVGIRQSYVFENNIGKVPVVELSDELKTQYKAENLFLRGWFYWQLLKQYGPFVKVTGVLTQGEDYNQYARTPFDTCVAYINELMDKAAQTLPQAWGSSANYGRPTKGSCLAVKAQLALFAASPLWNGNARFAAFKNQDGTQLAPTQYDAAKWKTAADAAKAVIALNTYKLYTNLDDGGATFDPYLSCRDVFLTTWNSEIILSNNNWSYWGWTKCSSPGPGGYNMYNATQNLVDAFSMKNGRTIDDPAAGYVETGFASAGGANAWEHKKGDWNMYANREPRFYVSIQYNGRAVLPAPTVDDKNYYSSDVNKDATGRTEFYYNGKSGQKSAGTNNITGYDVLKRISPSDNIRSDATTYRPYILIRYAEILLDYAEALNEYDPANGDVVKYLNLVRERAGLPGIETVYPSAVGNKEEMRKHILREREVELCFEGDRYHTLVRRLLLGKTEYQTIYGMNVNADDGGLGFSFTGFYQRTLFQKRYWDDRMYLFPIAQSDIERDRSLVQNLGW
ncbi:starch-binding protein [Niastella vici]|uniref:Starch-binding protein n=1 Tax=Niastella vici TaxID=1703345 RepID=A0A1V9FQF5_9BACT|nr:RagB/SusD family nutrient uptake outer membrane protein [Niastella vici]OQP60562.1 starch-binding protein [Niastella vici]